MQKSMYHGTASELLTVLCKIFHIFNSVLFIFYCSFINIGYYSELLHVCIIILYIRVVTQPNVESIIKISLIYPVLKTSRE